MRHALAALALAALALVAPRQAAAQAAPAPQREHPVATGPVLFSADEVQYDQELGLTVARGKVQLSQGSQILLADTVSYNQRTDTVTASGHVSLLQPTGDIIFADYVELHDDMREGFIKDLRMLLSDRSRLAGNTARRVAGTRLEIRRAVYSPCELCKDDPTRPPVWQIKGEKVIDDKDLQTVEYYDATMEIGGWPVLYSPYFSHPDPSVKRASGFLPPTIGFGNTLGFHTTVPYYWAIAPDKDLTLRPMITTGAGVVLGGEYRQRYGNGVMDNDASIEAGGGRQTESASGVGPPTGDVRWHVMGTGEWDIDDDWRAGYQVQRASDQTYMLRYHFDTPANYLTTHLYADDFGYNSYGNISSYAFQNLNPSVGDSVEPIVLPVASYEWTADPDRFGGRLTWSAGMLNLARRTGPEIRRLSSGAQWELPFDGLIGDRFSFTAGLRTDGYNSDHVALQPNFITVQTTTGTAIELPSNINTTTTNAARAFPQAALVWRYPWVRNDPDGSALVEPVVAAIAGPRGLNPARIPDEDSQGFEFDEMSLFVPNRFPGYDRVDSGQRFDYGVHGELHTQALGNFETLVGQSYRFQQNDAFPVGSGLNDRLSDIVGRVVATPNDKLDLVYRFRFDKNDFAPRRQEATIAVGPQSLRVSASFISISTPPSATSVPTGNQIGAAIQAELTRYWSLALNDTRFLAGNGATITSGISLTYRDDCMAVIATLTQSGIRVGDVRPGVSGLLTLVFKNLGEVGQRLFSATGP